MARPKGTIKPIDLVELEKLCALQCTQVEIAAFFEVSVPTIERRQRDSAFREIMDRGYAKGRISVRRKQMQLLEAGSNTMAVWLGKQLLGQKDRTEVSGPNNGAIDINVSPKDELRGRILGIAERIRAGQAPTIN
jgi:hypothetical protein